MRIVVIVLLVTNFCFAQNKERGPLIMSLNVSSMQGMTVVNVNEGSMCLFVPVGADFRKFNNVKPDTTELYDRKRRRFKQVGVSFVPAVFEQTKFTSFAKLDLLWGAARPLATHSWGIAIAKGLADRGIGSIVGGAQYSIATQRLPVTLLYLRGKDYNFFLVGLKIPLYDKVLKKRKNFEGK